MPLNPSNSPLEVVMLLAGLVIMAAGLAFAFTAKSQMRRTQARLQAGTDSYFEEQRARRSYPWLSGAAGIALRGLLLIARGGATCLVALCYPGI